MIVRPGGDVRSAMEVFARLGRWGTCAYCPRLADGTIVTELCEYTERYDHQLTAQQLADNIVRDQDHQARMVRERELLLAQQDLRKAI